MRIKFSILFVVVASIALAQKPKQFFDDKQLISTGVYYYPEHWDTAQWERDIKKIAEMGFEYTHYAEFAWA